MKSLSYIFALAVVAAGLASSCSKHELENYSGQDAIYFDQQLSGLAYESWNQLKNIPHRDYTSLNFNVTGEPDSIFQIKIETAGYVRDYDRPFKVEVVADSTTAIEGVEYELLTPDLSIAAGENLTYCALKLIKSDRMLTEVLQVQLRLVPGEHFTLPFGEKGMGNMPIRYLGNTASATETQDAYYKNKDVSVHNIFVTNKVAMPKWWENTLPGNMYYPGPYSDKKFALILNLTNEKYGWTSISLNADKIAMEKLNMLTRTLREYLIEQFNLGRDHYVLDEDGTMMWCKNCPWSQGADPDGFVE